MKIILIPGCPGLIQFYDEFLEELYKLTKGKIDILGFSHANHFENASPITFSLDQQIHHKKEILKQQISQSKN